MVQLLPKRSPRTVLYISARGMLTVHMSHGQPVSLDAFISEAEASDPDSAGIPSVPEFEQWLIERRHHRFDVLIDSVDEQQHLESLPALSLGDRHALIKRKLVQRFRDTDFTTYKLKAVRENGKRRLSVLFMALRGEEHFKPWLDLLTRHRVRVDSLVSPTLLTEALVERIKPGGSGLLVSLNPAGLRQTVVIDGRVRFSRLAALLTDEAEEIQAEVTRTMQYLLMSQRLSRSDVQEKSFEVWMIDTGFDQQIGVPETLYIDQGASVTVRIVDPAHLGISVLAGQTGLSLWLQMPRRLQINDYRTHAISRFSRAAAVRKWLWGASAATAALGLVAVLSADWLIKTHLPDTTHQRELLAQYEQHGFELTDALDQYPVTADEMNATVQLAQQVRQRTVLPWRMLRAVGNVMPAQAGLRINYLGWAPVAASDDSAQLVSGDATEPGQGAGSLSGTTRITIAGSVDPTWMKQEANQTVSLLANRLSDACHCQAEEVQLPYDPSPAVGIAQDYMDKGVKWTPYRIVLLAGPDSPVRNNGGNPL